VKHIILPWPPSVNVYYRAVPHGKHGARNILSAAGRQYKQDAARAFRLTHEGLSLHGRLYCHLTMRAPTRRKYDIDNRIKPVLDALQDVGAFDDDEQIDKILAERGIVNPGNGHVQITLRQIKGDIK